MPGLLSSLLLSPAAHAETWWVADPSAAGPLERALAERWPGEAHGVTVSAPGTDGLSWDGQTLVEHREGRVLRTASCADPEAAALLARSWAVPVAVTEGVWLPEPRSVGSYVVTAPPPRREPAGSADLGLGLQAALDEPGPIDGVRAEVGWQQGAVRLSAGVGGPLVRPPGVSREARPLRRDIEEEWDERGGEIDEPLVERHVLVDRLSLRLGADLGPSFHPGGVRISPRVLGGWELWAEEDILFTRSDIASLGWGLRTGPVVGALAEVELGRVTVRGGATARAIVVDGVGSDLRPLSPALQLDARVTL